jgi:hypothetical protein
MLVYRMRFLGLNPSLGTLVPCAVTRKRCLVLGSRLARVPNAPLADVSVRRGDAKLGPIVLAIPQTAADPGGDVAGSEPARHPDSTRPQVAPCLFTCLIFFAHSRNDHLQNWFSVCSRCEEPHGQTHRRPTGRCHSPKGSVQQSHAALSDGLLSRNLPKDTWHTVLSSTRLQCPPARRV